MTEPYWKATQLSLGGADARAYLASVWFSLSEKQFSGADCLISVQIDLCACFPIQFHFNEWILTHPGLIHLPSCLILSPLTWFISLFLIYLSSALTPWHSSLIYLRSFSICFSPCLHPVSTKLNVCTDFYQLSQALHTHNLDSTTYINASTGLSWPLTEGGAQKAAWACSSAYTTNTTKLPGLSLGVERPRALQPWLKIL